MCRFEISVCLLVSLISNNQYRPWSNHQLDRYKIRSDNKTAGTNHENTTKMASKWFKDININLPTKTNKTNTKTNREPRSARGHIWPPIKRSCHAGSVDHNNSFLLLWEKPLGCAAGAAQCFCRTKRNVSEKDPRWWKKVKVWKRA